MEPGIVARLLAENARLRERIRELSASPPAGEEVLRRDREEAFRNPLVAQCAAAIFALDLAGVVTAWNSAAQGMFGGGAGEEIWLVGRGGLDPDEVAARARELSAELGRPVEPGLEALVAGVRPGEPETREWSTVGRDGRRGGLLLTVSALIGPDGSVTGYLGVGIESTGMKAVLDEFSRMAAFRAALVACSGDPIVAYDLDGVITVWNPAAERMLGWTAAERVGKFGGSVVRSEVVARARELSEELGRPIAPGPEVFFAKARAGDPETREWTYVAKDGRRGSMTLTISALRDPGGTLTGYLSVGRDTTEIKASRAALEESEVRARQAARDLGRLNEELVRSNRDLKQFAHAVAHDLREPLRAVTVFLQMLVERNGAAFDERSREFAAHASDGAVRMGLLIENLLQYARVGRSGRVPAAVDCEQALGEALANLSESIREAGASIVVEALPVVTGDRLQLVSLFQNLVANAVKFRSDAPVEVRVDSRPGEAAGTAVIRVSDNGIGIDQQFHDRVFEMFRRLHTRAAYPGTGIGLALCRRIVEDAGGTIWIEPREPAGTTVAFTLPLAPR